MAFRDELHLFRQAGKAILDQHPREGVLDIYWGVAYTDREQTGKLAIRFNVSRKKAKSELKGSQLIPRFINGLPTDVTDFRFRNQVRDERAYDCVRPLLGGVQVQGGSFTGPLDWGTLGCERIYNGTRYAITNEHVVAAGDADGIADDRLFQPKKAGFGEIIGGLSSIGDPLLDYRLVRLSAGFDRDQSVNSIAGTIDGYMMASGMNELRLVKSGAASSVTAGIYEGRSLLQPHRVSIRAAAGGPVSLAGDSGSVWLNKASSGSLKIFALHTGADEERAVAIATLYASIHSSVQQQLRNGRV